MESKGTTRKQERVIRRGIQRGAYLTRQLIAVLYELDPGRVRLRTSRGISHPSLLRWFCGKRVKDGEREFPIPTIALLNRLPPEDSGRRPHLTPEMLEATWKEGWITLGEKWLFPRKVMKYLSTTFPTAVEAAAYARSLGSAAVGKGLFEMGYGDLTLRDLTTYSPSGEVIHAGSDGSGRIHPLHPVFKRLGFIGPIQVRIWNPDKGVFIKGILVPHDGCLDKKGKPTIWVDWEQVKGALKSLAKSKSGFSTGAFGENGKLLDSSKLQSLVTGEGYLMAVLQIWDKPGDMRWCFEILEKVQDSEKNRRFITQWLSESLRDLKTKGGYLKILSDAGEDNPKIKTILDLCRILEVSPAQVPFLASIAGEQLSRYLWHLRNGAGKLSRRYVPVMDKAVPEGRCVLADDKRRDAPIEWEEGDEVAVTRFPMVLTQNLRVLKVINPRMPEWRNLRHLLITLPNGKEDIPQNVIFMNPSDLEGRLMGDDDGDIVLVSEDPRAVEMYRSKLPMMGGDTERIFLIEPDALSGGERGKIPLVDSTGNVPQKALPILGLDGRGPVGQLTLYASFFLALGKPMHALATGVCIQEAIDGAKKDVMLSDPSKLLAEGAWEEKNGGWSPNPHTKAGKKWYGEENHLDMRTFARWASKETGGLKPSDILCWRSERGKSSDEEWEGTYPEVGGNLVHFCNAEASRLWAAWKGGETKGREIVDLKDLLLLALTRLTGLEWEIEPPERSNPEYQELLRRSGLLAFGQNMSRILKEYETSEEDEDSTRRLTREDRNLKVNAELEILASELQKLEMEELLVIWKTELTQAEKEPEHRNSYINRAFRAISFSGSPILKALGVDTPEPCNYSGDIPAIFHSLMEGVQSGKELDIFHAIAGWGLEDSLHEQTTGVKAHDCKECNKLLESLAISVVRKYNEDLQGNYREAIASTIKALNANLRRLTPDLSGFVEPPEDWIPEF